MSIILWSSHSEFASMSMSSAHVGAATQRNGADGNNAKEAT
jgi:hypothetical protein